MNHQFFFSFAFVIREFYPTNPSTHHLKERKEKKEKKFFIFFPYISNIYQKFEKIKIKIPFSSKHIYLNEFFRIYICLTEEEVSSSMPAKNIIWYRQVLDDPLRS